MYFACSEEIFMCFIDLTSTVAVIFMRLDSFAVSHWKIVKAIEYGAY